MVVSASKKMVSAKASRKVVSAEAPKEVATKIVAPTPAEAPDLINVLWPLATTLARHPEPPRQSRSQPRRRAIDVGAVITRALTAAGLMK
jgi:hypothetical protein